MFHTGEKLIWKPKGKKDFPVIFVSDVTQAQFYSGKVESVVFFAGSNRSIVVSTKNLRRPLKRYRVNIIVSAAEYGEAVALVRRGNGWLEKAEELPEKA